MSNPFKRFLALVPNPPLQVGEVIEFDDGVATVEMPGGGLVRVRGNATVGVSVFFRDGVIEGEAPNLTLEVIDV